MQLASFKSTFEVRKLDELREHLRHRHEEKFGSFWLDHPSGTKMALLVNGDEACIHFFPGGDHPGFQPEARAGDWSQHVEFRADNYEITPIPRPLVLPLTEALILIEEFFASGSLPAAIQWTEL